MNNYDLWQQNPWLYPSPFVNVRPLDQTGLLSAPVQRPQAPSFYNPATPTNPFPQPQQQKSLLDQFARNPDQIKKLLGQFHTNPTQPGIQPTPAVPAAMARMPINATRNPAVGPTGGYGLLGNPTDQFALPEWLTHLFD